MSASAAPTAGRKALGFLDLPSEIRVLIYKAAATDYDPADLIEETTKTPLKNHTGLLCTHSLINHEATSIFYINHTFCFSARYSEDGLSTMPATIARVLKSAQPHELRRIDIELSPWFFEYHIIKDVGKRLASDIRSLGLTTQLQQLRLCADFIPDDSAHTCGGDYLVCPRSPECPFKTHRRHFLLASACFWILCEDIGYERAAYRLESTKIPTGTNGHSHSHSRHYALLLKKGAAIEDGVS